MPILRSPSFPGVSRLGLLAAMLLFIGLGGCAQRPQEVAVAGHGKEYFPSSIYGNASRRVIADGQPVPRGGGQYLVGKPYTIAGHTYYPTESRKTQVGMASWYGDAFHGRLTANGEIYDRNGFTAASPTMPLPSYARVTNLRNNYSMIVRVNDRGPYHSNRIMDVSSRVAEALDYKRYGTTELKVEYVGRASLAGSDDGRLYATLRQDGPARWRGEGAPTMMAEVETPRARVASIAPYAPTPRARSEEDAEPETRPTRRFVEQPRPMRVAREPETEERVMPRRRVAYEAEPEHFERGRPGSLYGRQVYARQVYARQVAELPRRDHAFAPERGPGRVPPRVEARRFAEVEMAPPPRPHFGSRTEIASLARPPRHEFVRPPSRPMDLGTIPGAGVQIHAHRDAPHLRMARSRDD